MEIGGNGLHGFAEIALIVQAFQHELDDLGVLFQKILRHQLGPEIVLERLAVGGVDVPGIAEIVVVVIVLALIQVVVFLVKGVEPLLLFDGFLAAAGVWLGNVDYRIFQCQIADVGVQFLSSHL